MINTKLKVLAALMLSGGLVACGGSSGGSDPTPSSSSSSSSSNGDVDCEANPFDPACIEEDPESEIDITNQELPFTENFIVEAEGDNRVETFFSTDYKSLNTAMPQTLPNGDEYEDPNPSLYYATCCLWEEDEDTGEPTGELIFDIDERQFVGLDSEGNGYMAMSNARFTIGQLLPDIISAEEAESGDPKANTTDAPVGSSWGEFDLSEDYRVSFCVKDSGRAGAGTGGNLEIFVDNNSGGNQGHSIHGDQSVLLRTAAAGLEPGNRLVVDVPGDVRLQDNDGNEVELLSTTAEVYGTEHSFLQFRVSSGGYAVISDLMIEKQADAEDNYTPCVADSELFVPALPEGIAFGGLPLTSDFDMTDSEFLGEEAGSFLAISDDVTAPFYGFNSTQRVTVEGNVLHITNNRFTMGFKGLDDTEAGDEEVMGDMDLSVPYRVTFEIAEIPGDAFTGSSENPARLQVLVDNSTTTSGDSIHGENSVLLANTWSNLGTGTLEINVPGDVLLNDEPVLNAEGDPITIDAHYGTESSFFQVWCPSDCGPDLETEGAGVKFSEIKVEYQGTAPGVDPDAIWTGGNLQILGDDSVEGEVVSEDETSMQIEATGGNVDSSNHSIFFAHQQTDLGDFSFTARIADVQGATTAAGNGKRFGLMVMSDISNVGTAADVHGWADAGFYANGEPVALIGSRGNKKPDGSRTRSDIGDLEVGDYLRIEVFDDGENKRVRRCFSKDDGATWVQANSTDDFDATAETDSWYYGVYAAPGENEITMDVDNISIEAYEDTECVSPSS